MGKKHKNQHVSNELDVLGLGTATIDIILPVSEGFLVKHNQKKGTFNKADWETFTRILNSEEIEKIKITTGGCTLNTLKGLAKLGRKCAFFGKIGNDEISDVVYKKMGTHQIVSKLISAEGPTQQIICLLTPDYERTFCGFQGVAEHAYHEHELHEDIFQGTRMVYLEGYMLLNGDFVERAIQLAKKSGVKVSFDLGSHILVENHKNRILDILDSVDIVFANTDEARVLTGKSAHETCDYLRTICETVVILAGKNGCWVGNAREKIHCPANIVEAVDTTGAGDLFASGFIHAYLSGHDLKECGYCGNLHGEAAVQVYGAELSDEKYQEILNKKSHWSGYAGSKL